MVDLFKGFRWLRFIGLFALLIVVGLVFGLRSLTGGSAGVGVVILAGVVIFATAGSLIARREPALRERRSPRSGRNGGSNSGRNGGCFEVGAEIRGSRVVAGRGASPARGRPGSAGWSAIPRRRTRLSRRDELGQPAIERVHRIADGAGIPFALRCEPGVDLPGVAFVARGCNEAAVPVRPRIFGRLAADPERRSDRPIHRECWLSSLTTAASLRQ